MPMAEMRGNFVTHMAKEVTSFWSAGFIPVLTRYLIHLLNAADYRHV
jgi:hypothetical protein